MAQQVNLVIHGREFTVQTLANGTHLEAVAQYINSKFQEAERSVLSKSPTNIFALAALNIASNHLQLKESYELLLESGLSRIRRNWHLLHFEQRSLNEKLDKGSSCDWRLWPLIIYTFTSN